MGSIILRSLLFATFLEAPAACADDPRKLVDSAVAVAGGADKLPRIFRWKETYFVGPSTAAKGEPREAILVPPNQWYQAGKDIAAGNQDRTEKTYLVWVWTLAPLLDPESKLKALPDAKLGDKMIKGVRLTREKQKDIDVYFEAESSKLARIDWRDYQIDFADWKESAGFKYPAKSFVRFKDGLLHLRTEFQVLEVLLELPKDLKK